MHTRIMASHAKSQLLYLQMIMLKVDSEYARYILSMHTARCNYTQPLNNKKRIESSVVKKLLILFYPKS